MKLRTLMLQTHRWLGVAVSLLFVMWFVSGMVLMYWPFPGYSRTERLEHQAALKVGDLPSDSLLTALTPRLDSLTGGEPYTLSWGSSLYHGYHFTLVPVGEKPIQLSISGDTLSPVVVDEVHLEQVASLWGAKIERIDTIHDLDQWVPFSRLEPELPFYRLSLDKDGRQVYLSSLDGRVLTEHTRGERIAAWCGAIPHWVYFTFLRRDADLWRLVIQILSGIGILMIIAGIYVGIDVYRRSRTAKGYRSPYKKRSYYLHHVLGTLSGFFIFAWIASGFMSVSDVPEWMTGPADNSMIERLSNQTLSPDRYLVSLDSLVSRHPETRTIAWRSVNGAPFVELTQPDGKPICYRGDRHLEAGLDLSQEEAVAYVREARGEDFAYTAELMESYDGHYVDRHGKLPLPVYRIEIDDPEHHVAYLDPATLKLRLTNRNQRWERWVYSKPHSLQFAFLAERPWLWTLVMWTLLLLGLTVSVTGVILSYRAIVRSVRKRKRRK